MTRQVTRALGSGLWNTEALYTNSYIVWPSWTFECHCDSWLVNHYRWDLPPTIHYIEYETTNPCVGSVVGIRNSTHLWKSAEEPQTDVQVLIKKPRERFIAGPLGFTIDSVELYGPSWDLTIKCYGASHSVRSPRQERSFAMDKALKEKAKRYGIDNLLASPNIGRYQ